MVVFADPFDAASRAIIRLYRTALLAAGDPAQAELYARKVGNCHFFYFSPAAAKICGRIFEAFPADAIPDPCTLRGFTLIRAH